MILIIDNYDSFTFNLYQTIGMFNSDIVVYRNDAKTLEEFIAMPIAKLIISPGPGWPKDAGLTIPLIQHFAPLIPILGVCLGHQAIAEAFGGRVIHSKEIVHGKNCAIFHTEQGIFKGLPSPFEAGRYHSLIADKETLPDTLKIEAESSDGKIMALKHKNYPCWGVQFHPESVLTPKGQDIIENFMSLAD